MVCSYDMGGCIHDLMRLVFGEVLVAWQLLLVGLFGKVLDNFLCAYGKYWLGAVYFRLPLFVDKGHIG